MKPTQPRAKRPSKLKLPTLTVFKKLSLPERTQLFARWVEAKEGLYSYYDTHNCPLAQFGRALSPSIHEACSESIWPDVNDPDTQIKVVNGEGASALCREPLTFTDLAKRLSKHLNP